MRSWQSALSGGQRDDRRLPWIVVLLLVVVLGSTGLGNVRSLASTTTACATSSPSSGSYAVTVCFSSPASGASLTGNATVTVSVKSTGSAVQRVQFYLDGAYLLTDYTGTYTFSLPTEKWVDGSHSLSASATMRDGFVSARATRGVTFRNKVSSLPGNMASFTPTSGRTPPSGAAFVVAAAGDAASGEAYAGKVADMLRSINPNLLLYLGDVYEQGTATEFSNWYGNSSSFGSLRSITDPTVGNHEYLTPGAAGYYDYWNNIPKYYSFNAHGWHFVSLNSNGAYVPANAGSAQYNWLQNDLAKTPASMCTIVFYHHPYFNIGPEGPAPQMAAIWSLMENYGVDIVLNGHDHDYQRWQPLDANGNPSPRGITEFVVGSGGHGLQTFTQSDKRVAYANDENPTTFGALLLTLHSASADFSYRNTNGTVLDSGSVPCVTAAPEAVDTQVEMPPLSHSP